MIVFGGKKWLRKKNNVKQSCLKLQGNKEITWLLGKHRLHLQPFLYKLLYIVQTFVLILASYVNVRNKLPCDYASLL